MGEKIPIDQQYLIKTYICSKEFIGKMVFEKKKLKNSHKWSAKKGKVDFTGGIEFSGAKELTFSIPYQFKIKTTSSATANVSVQFFYSA